MVVLGTWLGVTADLGRWPPAAHYSSSPFFGRRCPRRALAGAASSSARRLGFLSCALPSLAAFLEPLVRRSPLFLAGFSAFLAFRWLPRVGSALCCPRPRVTGHSFSVPLVYPGDPCSVSSSPFVSRYVAGLWLAIDRPRAFPCGSRHGQTVGLSESLQLRVHATLCPTP